MEYYKSFLKDKSLNDELKIIQKMEKVDNIKKLKKLTDTLNEFYITNKSINSIHDRIRSGFLGIFENENKQTGGNVIAYNKEILNEMRDIGVFLNKLGYYTGYEIMNKEPPQKKEIHKDAFQEKITKLKKNIEDMFLLYSNLEDKIEKPVYLRITNKNALITALNTLKIRIYKENIDIINIIRILSEYSQGEIKQPENIEKDLYNYLKKMNNDTLQYYFLRHFTTVPKFFKFLAETYNIQVILLNQSELRNIVKLKLPDTTLYDNNISNIINTRKYNINDELAKNVPVKNTVDMNLFDLRGKYQEIVFCQNNINRNSNFVFLTPSSKKKFTLLEINGNLYYKWDNLPIQLQQIINNEC